MYFSSSLHKFCTQSMFFSWQKTERQQEGKPSCVSTPKPLLPLCYCQFTKQIMSRPWPREMKEYTLPTLRSWQKGACIILQQDSEELWPRNSSIDHDHTVRASELQFLDFIWALKEANVISSELGAMMKWALSLGPLLRARTEPPRESRAHRWSLLTGVDPQSSCRSQSHLLNIT